MEVPDANSGALPAHLAVEEVDTVAAPELEPAHA
jgi:hypothetical protein